MARTAMLRRIRSAGRPAPKGPAGMHVFRSLRILSGSRRARARAFSSGHRHACTFGFLLGCVPAVVGQTVFLADPAHFWQHESEYSGAETCRTCHPEIYVRQQTSNHARSLRVPSDVPELVSAMPFSVPDRVSGFTLRLSADASDGIRLSSENAASSSEALLEWAFGSGAKGITPIGKISSGSWVESRLTWYESLGDIDFTTGASKYDPKSAEESLGRGLTQQEVTECFGCHTTGFDERALAPKGDEIGVRCERCHGPGSEHVGAAMSGKPIQGTIFNPRSLAGFPQTQMCGACHGRPPQDNDFDALRLLEQTPHSVRFPSQRIVLSRCFNETFGGIACTNCHDPHGDVADEDDQFDTACLACHDRKSREHAAVCTVASADCSSCHMPKERVMRHSMFSDHWIRVVHAN